MHHDTSHDQFSLQYQTFIEYITLKTRMNYMGKLEYDGMYMIYGHGAYTYTFSY
jgi:hypothetical protein